MPHLLRQLLLAVGPTVLRPIGFAIPSRAFPPLQGLSVPPKVLPPIAPATPASRVQHPRRLQLLPQPPALVWIANQQFRHRLQTPVLRLPKVPQPVARPNPHSRHCLMPELRSFDPGAFEGKQFRSDAHPNGFRAPRSCPRTTLALLRLPIAVRSKTVPSRQQRPKPFPHFVVQAKPQPGFPSDRRARLLWQPTASAFLQPPDAFPPTPKSSRSIRCRHWPAVRATPPRQRPGPALPPPTHQCGRRSTSVPAQAQ